MSVANVFADDFIWGTATAAAQVEGAYNEDGKCLSIWDMADGHIKDGTNCHRACDHYHRYKEDVALMKEIGANSYRFSISWCRIMPEEGVINQKGIDFYRNLIDELKAAGIRPMITLYHWDLPQWVQKKGGWANPKIIDWFLKYAAVCVDNYSKDVGYWMTFNEPTCFLMMGNLQGVHAPFEHRVFSFRKMVRNMLVAHGKTVTMIRARAAAPVKVGIVMAAGAYVPDSDRPEDIEYARKCTFESKAGMSQNSLYMDPIVLKKPASMLKGELSAADLEIIGTPIDFIGINTYQPMNERVKRRDGSQKRYEKHTMLDWAVDGKCIYWVLRFYSERYNLPLIISENGAAYPDKVSDDGKVHDTERREFIEEYLKNLKRAYTEGIPVFGYLYWSLMDNFEWAEGYVPRFGLVHVDYETEVRIIKESAYYYKHVIETAGAEL